jgi:ParB family chromosome partitioning protein
MTQIQQIALQDLRFSPSNVRKTGSTDIDDLMASLEAEGVLNNLVVTAGNDGLYYVEDGGRRLRALHQMDEDGRLPAALREVPCKIVDADNAVEAGLSANIIRMAMHPADEFVAFKRLVDDGNTVDEIATRFGKSPRYIAQRLKLANVRPELFELYREDGMTLDQLVALASTDNHEMQRQAWETAAGDWERQPHALRKYLARDSIGAGEALATFVGLDAYESAGGRVQRNLFNDDVRLTNLALLDSLAMDKLEAIAQQHRDAGWSWAEARINMAYEERAEFPRLLFAGQEPPELFGTLEDEARHAVLDARQTEIYDIDEDSLSEEEKNSLQDELQRIEAELSDIDDRMVQVYPDEVKGKSGVLVFTDNSGLNVSYARLRPGEKAGKDGKVSGAPAANAKQEKPKKADLSDAVRTSLAAHRSEVARLHIIRDPTLALCLLIHRLLQSHWPNTYGRNGVCIDTGRTSEAAKVADVHKAVRTALADEVKKLSAIPKRDTLQWLMAQTDAQRLDILALLVANSFDGITAYRDGHETVADIHQIVGFDMADHWNPTVDDFLGRIHGDLVVQAVTEAKGKDAAATLTGLKKAERVATAGKLLAGTGWLPKLLRGADYGKKKATAPVADAPAKAKKPTAKKPAAKKAAKKAVKKAAKKVVAKKAAG